MVVNNCAMTTDRANDIITILKKKNIHFENGLTGNEVLQIETKFGFQFPPDLKLFLQTALPVSERFVNWRLGLISTDEAENIISRLNWPWDGIVFDLQNNNFWDDSLGPQPGNIEDKIAIAKKHYEKFPRLIPIYSHRYISSLPNKPGNPVFSIYQTDIIYYGHDLAAYFANEFHFTPSGGFEMPDESVRKIEFWSNLVS